MKKILLIDPLSPKGHKDINIMYLNILSQQFNVKYISSESYIDDQYFTNVKNIGLDVKLFRNGSSLGNRLRYFKILNTAFKKVNNEHFDAIIILSYETISFSIYTLLQNKVLNKLSNRIYLMNHANIDEIRQSKIKRTFFKLIPENIVHICYEDFITNFVIDIYNKKAITVRHNLNNYKKQYIDNNRVRREIKEWFSIEAIHIVSLSNNDISDELIEVILKLDKNKYFSDRNIKLFIKNRKIEYISKNVHIFKGFLDENEYSYTMYNSDYVFLPYQSSKYEMRISGVFFDALTFNKPLICAETKFFKFVFDKFGSIGYIYKNYDQLVEIFDNLKIKNACFYQDVIKIVKEYYSDDNLKYDLMNLINI